MGRLRFSVRGLNMCVVYSIKTIMQGKFIYIPHFIHSGNAKCFTWEKLK